jgi:hypothetical protein
MEPAHTVIVHGLGEAAAALAKGRAEGRAVVLLSAPGAALHAGCGWWRALVASARGSHPDVICSDILDCADGTGQALAALRIGLTRLVLWPDAPGREAVVAIAESTGGFVLPAPPPVDLQPTWASRSRIVGAGRGAENSDPPIGDKTPSPG